MRISLVVSSAAAVVATLAAPSAIAENLNGADHGGRPLSTSMTGAEEVPGPGDPDGTGTAMLTLNQGQEEICYELTVENVEDVRAAHIHRAPAGVAGPVVVPLVPPVGGTSSACATVDPALIKEIRKNPEQFYVNVHSVAFPGGAVRGQLG